MEIPLELIITYLDNPVVIPSVSDGPLAKIAGVRAFPEANNRPISQQEIMEYSPTNSSLGFIHNWFIYN